MKVLILGAGNSLLSDEGFGVHLIRYLQEHYRFPDTVELFDAGTMGIMAIHKIEEADCVFIVDTVEADEPPGTLLQYGKDAFMLNKVPVKLSPHQVGIQEMLLVSEMRGRCPWELLLIGIIPASTEPGTELSGLLRAKLPETAGMLMDALRKLGITEMDPAGTLSARTSAAPNKNQ